MIGRLPIAAQRRIHRTAGRRFRIHILNNAITNGFPTGGPYKRTGFPPLPDGEYEIVECADGIWRYGDTVVLERVFG